jgi:hypothetical protein
MLEREGAGARSEQTGALNLRKVGNVRRMIAERTRAVATMPDMATRDDAVTPEAAVRLYLMYLEDPSKLVDAATVERLRGEVEKAKDPIDRLRAIAALERAQATDEGTYKYDFIKHAKGWADAEGVPASAFRQLGVPDDVIVAAGLDGRRRRGRARAAAPAAPRTRRPAVRAEQLEEGILGLEGPFTTKDVMDRVGGSPLTVRSAIERLEAQGRVERAGERAGMRGRAAKAWKVA